MFRRNFLLSLLLGSAMLSSACAVEKTREGKAPDVDLSVKEGQMPKYEVKGVDVDVKTKEKVVTVPDVDINMPDETRDND